MNIKTESSIRNSFKKAAMCLIYRIWNQRRDLYKGRFLLLLGRGYMLLLVLLALPVIILVRLLRSLVLIRFGRLVKR